MPKLDEIAEGVWVWLQPGGESGVSNAGVIADDDGLTIVDTLMVRSQWEPFAAAVAKLGRPIRRLLLTHAHVDHVGVLFAGDLCFFGVTPLAFKGDPKMWADVLDAVAELAEVIVPGHGPAGGEAEVRDLQQYLRYCVAGEIPPGPWDGWPE